MDHNKEPDYYADVIQSLHVYADFMLIYSRYANNFQLFLAYAYEGTNIITLFARYSEICLIYHKRNELFYNYTLIRQKMNFKSLCWCLFINIHECANNIVYIKHSAFKLYMLL